MPKLYSPEARVFVSCIFLQAILTLTSKTGVMLKFEGKLINSLSRSFIDKLVGDELTMRPNKLVFAPGKNFLV